MICSCVLSIYTEKNHRKRIRKIGHFLQNSGFFLKMRRIVEKMIHIENPCQDFCQCGCIFSIKTILLGWGIYGGEKFIKHAKCSPFDINIIHESYFFIWFPARTIPYSPDKPKATRKLNLVSRNEQGRPLKELNKVSWKHVQLTFRVSISRQNA